MDDDGWNWEPDIDPRGGGAWETGGLEVDRSLQLRNELNMDAKARRDSLYADFLISETGLKDARAWYGVKELGQGGFGKAGLWVKIDARTQQIVDRLVIKTSVLTGNQWYADKTWVPGKKFKIPKEAGIQMLLSTEYNMQIYEIARCFSFLGSFQAVAKIFSKDISASFKSLSIGGWSKQKRSPNKSPPLRTRKDVLDAPEECETTTPPNVRRTSKTSSKSSKRSSVFSRRVPPITKDNGIVKVRGYRVDDIKYTYSLHMDFMSAGDIFNLWESYSGLHEDPGSGAFVQRAAARRVPEPFLWFLLHRLMVACKTMEKVEHTGGALEVVHQDIKMENIFMDVPEPDHYPFYPRGKVADFGGARLTSAKDPSHPKGWLRDAKTEGWHPPENRPNDPYAPRLTSAANVWQCAKVVACLMCIDCEEPFPSHSRDLMPLLYNKAYSPELIRTVQACMNFYPEARPCPERVLKQIEDDEEKRLEGMRTVAGGANEPRNTIDIGEVVDTYKIGMTYRPPPPSSSPSPSPFPGPADVFLNNGNRDPNDYGGTDVLEPRGGPGSSDADSIDPESASSDYSSW